MIYFFVFENALKQGVLRQGNYTASELATEIQRSMFYAVASLVIFSVSYYKPTNSIAVAWDPNYIALTANIGKTFTIPTTFELQSYTVPTTATKARNCNELLKNFTNYQTYTGTKPFVSGHIDMSPLRNVYLSCSGLGNFSTVGLTGDRNIIKKIAINGQPGSIIYDATQTGVDYLDCSRQTLSRISFQLKDNYGQLINMNGVHWSFSLVFSRVQNGI